MGNTASKAAKKYPTRPPPAAPPHSAAPRPPIRPVNENAIPVADSHRSQGDWRVTEKDGADPQFLSNLSSLGQVRVDHHMQPIRSEADITTRLFASRTKADLLLSSALGTGEIINATALSELLDRRKSIRTQTELEKLSTEFGLKVDILENLARFVNSPSIDKSTIRPAAGNSEEEGFVATAVWMEPAVQK